MKSSQPHQQSSTLSGVEENEYSRYIDFSICTPWEQLIADVETSMTSLLQQEKTHLTQTATIIDDQQSNSTRYSFRAPLKYRGCEYVIRLEKKPMEFENSISSWFGTLRYFIVSHSTDWLMSPTQSNMRTFYSAIIVAMDTLLGPSTSERDFVLPPVFLTPSTHERYHVSNSMLGYHLIKIPRFPGREVIESPDYPTLLLRSIMLRYESKREDINTSLHKHPFYHLDNIWDFFVSKLVSLQPKWGDVETHLDTIARLEEDIFANASIEIRECYDYIAEDNEYISLLSSLDGEYLVRNYDSSRSYSFISDTISNDEENITTGSSEVERHPFDSTSRVVFIGKQLRKLRSIAKYIQCAIPAGERIFRTNKSIVSKIQVKIKYSGPRKSLCVDNEIDSVLKPQKLPCSAYSMHASFAPLPTLAAGETNSSTPLSLSKSLRTLLACFIMGKSSKHGLLASNLFGAAGMLSEVFDFASANKIAKDLSPATQSLVKIFCSEKNPAKSTPSSSKATGRSPVKKAANNVSESLHSTFLDILFQTDTPENLQDTDTSDILRELSKEINFEIKSPSNCDTVGLGWLGLVGVYVGCLHDGGIMNGISFWHECTKRLRASWEFEIPLQHMGRYLPIDKKSSLRQNDDDLPMTQDALNGGHIDGLGKSWLCMKPLWDDKLDEINRRSDSAMYLRWKVCLPNQKYPLFVQKLQMLNLSSAMKRESLLISSEDAINPAGGSSSNVASDKGFTLLRRLPITDDMITQYYRVSNRLENLSSDGEDTSTTNTVKWSLLMPSLISDMRAFKAALPASDFDVFCLWYFDDCSDSSHDDGDDVLELSEVIYDRMEEIWNSCDPCAAEKQKPLFRIETEAEKSLTYFENMTPTQLFAELIISAMPAIFSILLNEICSIVLDIFGHVSTSGDPTNNEVLCKTFRIIKASNELANMIEQASKELRVDVNNEETEQLLSPMALQSIDRVANKIQEIEEFLLRYYSLSSMLTVSKVSSYLAAEADSTDASAPATAWDLVQYPEASSNDNDIRRTVILLCMDGEITCMLPSELVIYLQITLNSCWHAKSTPSGFRKWIRQSRRVVAARKKSFLLRYTNQFSRSQLPGLIGLKDVKETDGEEIVTNRLAIDFFNKDYIRMSMKTVSCDI